MFDVIVIGGGPAGMSAALYLLRNDKKVLIIEKNNFGGQISTSPRLENFPTIKSISGMEFSDLFFQQIIDLGVEFELEDVEAVSKEGNTFVVKTNYHSYEAKTVVVANGVTPRKLNLPKEDELRGKGVSYCAVCDGPFYKDQETYLIGDGNTAMTYALLLTDYSSHVHVYTLFDKFFGEQTLIDAINSNQKITVRHNVQLTKLIGENELESVIFKDLKTNEEKEVKTNNVFVAIGQIPNNNFLKDLVDLENGFIITDANMATTVPGLFAAGDTIKKETRQVVTACNDGAIAAVNVMKYLSSLE